MSPRLQHVAHLQQSLPLLEELAISILRSLGDESEADIYKTLGMFSGLSNLSHYLDCEDTNLLLYAADEDADTYETEPVLYADFDHFDKEDVADPGPVIRSDSRQVRKGHIRHAMMNAAPNNDLARAAFGVIAKLKLGLASGSPLERLELRPVRRE